MPDRFFPGYPVRRFGGGVEIFHIIFMVLLIAALVMLVVWLVTSFRRGQLLHEHAPPARSATDAALQEARMRYARGEMTREEFLQISTDLGGSPPLPEPHAPGSG
jgi:putative membrane protein